ncbi:MAG: glycosyltransferase family 4 protein [Chthoniobacterales bacterium]
MPDFQPKNVFYATSARLGGVGLDTVALESVAGLYEAGVLGKALAYENRQMRVPADKIQTMRGAPVKLLSGLRRDYYYGAKKHYADWVASRTLARGEFDAFHGWSGDALRTLRVAKGRGVPSLLEIPTWHRNKGKIKPAITKSERERDRAAWPQSWLNQLLITRQHVMEEYELADLILVLSEKAAETFLVQGVPEEKLFRFSRGVDPVRFAPPEQRPEKLRFLFVGALIQRKGVHVLLEAWKKLALPNAELVLVGSLHAEIEPYLQQFKTDSVRLAGFAGSVEESYRSAHIHVFPSECEGSAKVTYEAAACGLAQITTRESGDVVIDGLNGLIIPPNNVDALVAAMGKLAADPDLVARMGAAGRERILENFTWRHFRQRLLEAHRVAWQRVHG